VQLDVASLISGHVISTQARWAESDDDGARIITDAIVETSDGTRVTVSQLGGELDGFGQISMPGPALLAPGMFVTVDAHDGVTLRGAHAMVVDDVEIDRVAGAGSDPFVREGPTPAGSYLFWPNGCVFMTYDAAGTSELAGDTEFPIIDAAMATWNNGVAACGYIELMGAGKASGHEVGKDYINLIKFRDDKWCIPATDTEPEHCHAAAAAGITTLTFIKHAGASDDGAIVDADVEINGVNFAITNGTSGGGKCAADLGNTITHELGHVLGLEHTCVTADDPPRKDNNGDAVPACPSSDPRITEATMYPYQTCGETKKKTLSDDDIAGACAIYPTAQDPKTCSVAQAPSGCCDASAAPGSSSLLAALILFRFRRRDRSSTKAPRSIRA
jgi:hypothetical protein